MPPTPPNADRTGNPPPSPEPLIQSELLRSIVDSTADGIVVADATGRFLLFNPAAEQMIGIGLTDSSPAEWSALYGCFLSDGVTPLAPEEVPLARAIRGENVDAFQMMVRNPARPEGVWISCHARPLWNGERQLCGGVVAFHDITQQKMAEEEIRKLNAELRRHAREQETRYRLAAKATRDAIWDWDLLTNQIEWNEGLQILFGHSLDDVLRDIDWWSEHIHPDDRDRVVQGIYAVIHSGENTWSDEYRFACQNGSYALVVDRGHVVRDDTGRPVRMVGAMLDMTERKRSEEALAHSLSLLEATLDSTADGLLVVDGEGRIVSFNRKFVDMWNIPEEVLATRDDLAAIRYALQLVKAPDGFLAKVRELYARPDAVSFDVLELSDGRVFERYSQSRRLAGASVGRVWSFRDVTERHRAEQMLQGQREFLETLLENCSEGIVACDATGRMTLLNRAMRELYKLPPDFLPPIDWFEGYALYHADGKTRIAVEDIPLFRALRGEHVRNAEVVTIDQDGTRRQLLVSGNAIFGPKGDKRGAVLVLHDVTEHDRLQRQLLQTQKLESIGTLAGGIAHDFNNLLAVIMGNSSVLLRDKSLPPKVRDSLTDIIDAAERGSSLTHQLLVYARGGLQRLGPTDLSATIQSVLQMLRRTSPPQIEFLTDLPINLPAIMADSGQIEQVLMNLCLNAIQASCPPCQIEIRARVDELKEEDAAALELSSGAYARLEVQDHGCGMDAATIDRIFEPFFTTKFTGRGMGLAATLGIVNSHHGQIRASSTVGQGTLMTVWLPLADGPVPIRPPPRGARLRGAPTGTETILVVDDDPAVSRAVVQILASLGYCVVSHNDAAAATAFLDTNAEDVDLVVLDLNMPKLSSEGLYEAIKKRCKGAPILLASGVDQPLISQSARSWGAAGYLQKPFSTNVLARAVRLALDGRSAATEDE